MNKKVVVPEGMLKAAWDAQLPADPPTYPWEDADSIGRSFYVRLLGAALLWWSENPIMPEHYVYDELYEECSQRDGMELTLDIMELWQRRMFLAPEPEIPEELKDLIFYSETGEEMNSHQTQVVLEAYRRGKESR